MLMKDDEGGMGGQANDDGPRQYLLGKQRPQSSALQVATHKRLINLSGAPSTGRKCLATHAK